MERGRRGAGDLAPSLWNQWPPLGPGKSGVTAIICANGCELTRIGGRSANSTVTQVALVKPTGFQNNAETHKYVVEGLLEGEEMNRSVRKRVGGRVRQEQSECIVSMSSNVKE